MRRHDTRHVHTAARRSAARALTAGLLTIGLLGAAGACSRSDESAAPEASSAGSSATPSATTAASPISKAALDEAITLTTPAEGATVDRSFLVRGSGVAFEGTLLWNLAHSGGGEAVSGYATAGTTEKQPFQFTVEAPGSGEYTLTVYRESAADGARTDAVARTITVR